MAHMLIRHRVHDFDKWKATYDAHRQTRAAAGLKDLHLWHNVDSRDDAHHFSSGGFIVRKPR